MVRGSRGAEEREFVKQRSNMSLRIRMCVSITRARTNVRVKRCLLCVLAAGQWCLYVPLYPQQRRREHSSIETMTELAGD